MRELVLGDALDQLIDHRGKTPRKLGADFVDTGVPVASALLVKNGRLNLEEARYVDTGTFERWMPAPTRRGDVILTSEAPLGCVALVTSDEPLVLGQRLFGLRGRAGVLDSRYLFYALQADQVQNDLLGRSTGTTVFGIRQSALRQVRIPAPDFSEQQAIAEVLGALDDKIAANVRQFKLLLDLADAHFITELGPATNTATSLGELADRRVIALSDGYRTKQSEYGQPGLRILRAGDIRGGRIFLDGPDFVSDSYRGQIGQKISRPGDIVLTTKGTVGRVALVPLNIPQFVYSPQLCYFRVLNESVLDAGYLAAWFRSRNFQEQASRLMFKSDMAPYISLRDIRTLSVPLPSVSEQRKYGDKQRALSARFDAACTESDALARTRDELLPLLMSGKLRVRDVEKAVEEVV